MNQVGYYNSKSKGSNGTNITINISTGNGATGNPGTGTLIPVEKPTQPFQLNVPMNPSALKQMLIINDEYLNKNNITNKIKISGTDYLNYSGFIVEKADITIILPDIINIYLSLTIINSSSNDITIESDNPAHLLYNSIFISPNGEFSYKLPSSKMVIANNVKKGLGWIWSVIVS
jgi:hypothetical protein